MATITPNKMNGFTITGANRIKANFTITVAEVPGGPVGGTPFVFTITFPRTSALPPKMMVGQLSRDVVGGGLESTSIGVSSTTGDIDVPLGVFAGRGVVWKVTDVYTKRTLQVTICSRDTMGTDESWHQELQITAPPGGITNFDIGIVSGVGVVSSVDVTP